MGPTVTQPQIVIRYFREALEQSGMLSDWTPAAAVLVEQAIFPRLKGIPLDRLRHPDAQVLAEAMPLVHQRPEVPAPVINLLAAAMHADTAAEAYHGFVEVLGHLNTEELMLLRHMKPGREYPVEELQLTQAAQPFRRWHLLYAELAAIAGLAFAGSLRDYLKILRGLGLVHLDPRVYGAARSAKDLSDEALLEQVVNLTGTGAGARIVQRESLSLQLTRFGAMFCAVCLPSKA